MVHSFINLQLTDFAKEDLIMKTTELLSCYLQEQRSFEGINLHQANLQGFNLPRINLTRADLSGANLQGTDLSGACLKQANLEKIQHCQLKEPLSVHSPNWVSWSG
jgi:uncharacterized protein YjbI with pentapeptide repeats